MRIGSLDVHEPSKFTTAILSDLNHTQVCSSGGPTEQLQLRLALVSLPQFQGASNPLATLAGTNHGRSSIQGQEVEQLPQECAALSE